jgi:hypothetical protein
MVERISITDSSVVFVRLFSLPGHFANTTIAAFLSMSGTRDGRRCDFYCGNSVSAERPAGQIGQDVYLVSRAVREERWTSLMRDLIYVD